MSRFNKLKKRLFHISYLLELSHISSCLTSLPIIMHIYKMRKKNEPFVLSNGHAGLALYIVLEDEYSRENGHYGINAITLFKKHGVHPNRDLANGIYCSTGSLGHGLAIAVGMALADRDRSVYCLISDGELAEGIVWESLAIAKKFCLKNLIIYLNYNGHSAYDNVNMLEMIEKLRGFGFPIKVWKAREIEFNFLKGIKGHYHKLDDLDYKELCNATSLKEVISLTS
jgi:transketolase